MPIFKGPTKDQDRLGVPALMRKRTLYSRKRAEPMPLTALDRKKAGLPPPGLEKGRKRKAPEFLPMLASQTPEAAPKRARKSFNSQDFFDARTFPLSTGVRLEPDFSESETTQRKPRAIKTPKAEHKRPKKARVTDSKIAPPQPQTFAIPFMDFYAEPQAQILEEAPTAKKRELRKARLVPEPPEPKTASKKQKTLGTLTHYYDKIKVGVIKLSSTLSVGDCIKFETLEGDEYEQVVESMEIDREPVFKAGKGKSIGLKLSRAPKIGCNVTKA
jgi:hypothetical protein